MENYEICQNEFANSLTTITNCELVYYPTVSTTTPYEVHTTLTYIPLIAYILIAIPLIIIFNRIVIEFLIRWRHKL